MQILHDRALPKWAETVVTVVVTTPRSGCPHSGVDKGFGPQNPVPDGCGVVLKKLCTRDGLAWPTYIDVDIGKVFRNWGLLKKAKPLQRILFQR
jgi:hypothetical protein